MFRTKYLFYFILIHFIIATPQINLHFTDLINENESSDVLQHNCLRVAAFMGTSRLDREIITYCMNDLPSKFDIENDNIFPKFKFSELSQQNITSQQLYIWSAPIDIIERYQFYLDQLSASYDKSMETQVFYNCTLPRFGPMCQYEMIVYEQNYMSLYDIIVGYYRAYGYRPTKLTCYTHLECNRGSFSACLDWSDICNGYVDCVDGGSDEEHCWQLEINECNDNEYRCHNGQCIPREFFRDDTGSPDCVDGSDEILELSQHVYQCTIQQPSFECEEKTLNIDGKNETDETECEQWPCKNIYTHCDGIWNCPNGADEIGCYLSPTLNCSSDHHICIEPITHELMCLPITKANNEMLSDVRHFLCYEIQRKEKQQPKYLSLNASREVVENHNENKVNSVNSRSPFFEIYPQREYECHRGLGLRVWLNDTKNLTTYACLCPPSFYGEQCQYQNQRVSLTIKFQTLSDSLSTLFAIIISLIDDGEERIIHSHEQFTYLSSRDCKVKFNAYLLYSTRPKNQTKTYLIHIDIYEKFSLNYRGSLLFPIKFPFLPVYRLVLIAVIPRKDAKYPRCSKSQCVHGKCMIYSNQPENVTFCQCNQGWSGRFCTIPHTSMCSSDSISIGLSAYNRSICVCPINKFGPCCLLIDSICQTNNNLTCQNGGQCIPMDEYTESNQKFLCICPKGYIGDLCELIDNKLIIKFEHDVALSQTIMIHFINIIRNAAPIRTTTLRTMPLTQISLTIYWSRPFHIVFVELQNKIYYLAVVQKTYQRSITTTTIINKSDRCQHINELFNETFVKLNLLRRIKYYHLPCQNLSTNLTCFYDNLHLCFCYDYQQQRLANCFKFNHDMKFDCFGQSVCENEGKCFQDTPDCPQRATCICLPCFYGARCQFISTRFGLSLDAILGYHIQPNNTLRHQSNIVKISLVLTIIFMIAGFINGILSFITFNNKTICEVGCGLYLLGSSITTLFTTIIFGLKFWILLLAQMTIISNPLFLRIQCISLDFLLRVFLNMDQWLNACIALERAITTLMAAGFDKKKSKQIAKIVISILIMFMIGTNIYDPIYRRLIDEENEDEKRTWCIVTYPSSLQTFNSFMQTFHFLVPFLINLISAVILIIKKSRQQSNVRPNRAYKQILKQQIQKHKHLITAPVILVILGIPRLVISFISQCMKSTNDAYLFIAGYFVSFIPPMVTFLVFVLPSEFYKKQLYASLTTFRTTIQRYLQRIR
ncbi:unnamed protein product [Rotaria sp. Silwood1]|nr:unnamed protein product [Rotaria sp. Silwood1]